MTAATENATCAAALRCADRGWAVFPCAGKTPLVTHGLKDATATDKGLIGGWWNSWPDANLAIVTGAVSGIVVLDIDVGDEDGYETLRQLEAEHGELPLTGSVKTPSGGAHLYFKHPGTDFRNSVRKLGPGLDVRGDGGYVIAPPSAGYVVDEEAPVAALPPWILETAARKQAKAAEPVGEIIVNGRRNDTLASLAGTMRRRGMAEPAILAALRETNRTQVRPPLSDEEVAKIAASISQYAPADQPSAQTRAEGSAKTEYRVTFTETKPPKLVLPEVPEVDDQAGHCAWLSSVFRLDPAHPVTAGRHEGLRGAEGHVVLKRAGAPDIRFEPVAVLTTSRRLRAYLPWQLQPTDDEVYGFKDDHCNRIAHVVRLLCGACAAPDESAETAAVVGTFLSDAIVIEGCTTFGSTTEKYQAISALKPRIDEQSGRMYGQSHCLIDSQTGEYVIRAGDLQAAARRHLGASVPHGWLDARMDNLGWSRLTLQGYAEPGREGRRGPHLKCGVYRGLLAAEDDQSSTETVNT